MDTNMLNIVTQTSYSTDDLARMIHSSGVRVSAPRLAVLDFIYNRRTHPTVDEIYNALHPVYPSMSRTTVYNSLHVLTDAGLVRQLEIEAGVMRYDMAPQERHGHFLCRRCGTVYDIPFPSQLSLPAEGGFQVDCMEWNCKGLCPECKSKTDNTISI